MRIVILASALTCAGASAQDDVQFFSSQADFDAAVDTTLGITFEEPAWDEYVGVAGPTPKFFNGVLFNSLDAPNLFVAPPGQQNFGFIPLSRVLTVSGNENVDLTFDDPPTAVGFEFYANDGDPAIITVELVGGAEFVWENEQAPDTLGYVGIVAAKPIARINWTAFLGQITNTGIDNVASDTFACAADINADGALNILDFVAFQAAWQNQDPAGDCTGDGVYNILDFVCYQGLFLDGCP
jgi:hypothetical protein